ncbi:DUF4288 domain-containing protein [Sorangium sp. So ce1153]|uniref:DUF4288 domain-containing protein n=1 Tax=Sorangium sp. So ce1153 TaxID=3133333 RepID=UPI003F5F875C
MNSSPNPTLYVAILLYESSSLDPSYTPLFEECFVLLRADNDEQARARAEQHSRVHETCFNNAAGQEIHWKLKHVVDVSRVLSDTLDDGAELYSRHFKDYGAYHAFEPLLSGGLD